MPYRSRRLASEGGTFGVDSKRHDVDLVPRDVYTSEISSFADSEIVTTASNLEYPDASIRSRMVIGYHFGAIASLMLIIFFPFVGTCPMNPIDGSVKWWIHRPSRCVHWSITRSA
jgi:hypothetical protein